MPVQPDALRVPLDGFTMQLRASEAEAVSGGVAEFNAARQGDIMTLVEAVRALPTSDRAPLWELLIRRYARRKPLAQAAGEIGMDRLRAESLLQTFAQTLPQA